MLLQGPGSGAEPATHAFVVGVSHYPFLNGPKQTSRGEELRMVDLSSAARSASDVAAWLLTKYHNPAAPLADISIFLSPSDREKLNPVVAKALGRKKLQPSATRSRLPSRSSGPRAPAIPTTSPSSTWRVTGCSSSCTAP